MRALGFPLARPVGTGAVYLGILALGAAALPGVPLGLAPDLEALRLAVSWTWRDASPETMEALVPSPIEAEIARLPGVDEIVSNSGPGWGWVEVSFQRDARVDVAEIVLRERLAGLRPSLPRDLDPPLIERSVSREMDPGDFFVLRMTGDRTPEALRRLLETNVLPRLAGVPGVSRTEAYGGSRPEIRVDVDRSAWERGALDPAAIGGALDRIGGRRAAGHVRTGDQRLPVAVEGRPVEAERLAATTIPSRGGVVRIDDIARVTEAQEEPRALSRLDGRPSVPGVLERAGGTNVLRVAADARAALAEAARTLPPDVGVTVVHDESEQIREEIVVLLRRSGISLGLIALVLVAARGSVRVPAVVMLSVLFSAVATFLLFRAFDLGINLVTLSGVALSFGMAVDNSIVLLENVSLRTRGRGAGRRRLRTLAATREVLFPLLAATATTAVVLTPFLRLESDLRDYYLPFVLAVVLSLVASLVVALTLSPMLARWADAGGSLGRRFPRLGAAGLRVGLAFEAGFARLLDGFLRRAWLPVTVSAFLLAASLWVFEEKISKGSIFSPQADTVMRVSVGMPPGADIAATDALIRAFEDPVLAHEFRRRGWIDQVETFVREDRGNLSVRFHPAVAHSAIPLTLQEEASRRAALVSGADVAVSGQGPGFQRGNASVSPSYALRVRGPDYRRLEELSESIAGVLRRNGRIRDVDTRGAGLFVEDARELALVPDRARMAEVGLTMRELVTGMEPALSSETGTRRWIRSDGTEVAGRVRFDDGRELSPVELLATRIPTRRGSTAAVGEVARIEERSVPAEIRRRDQQYERTIAFEYRGPRRVGDRFVRSLVENTSLPAGYTLEDGLGLFLTGSEENEILFAIAIAIILVGMVAAALFESFLLPFVALLSIPLSFVGIPFTFWATGESFDRTAYVGLIQLAGIAINNAQLLVHRAGRLRRRGLAARTAARRAARARLRPILLTTATSVAGLVPLAAATDAAAASTWRALALSAIAGLLASAAFTLLVIPCLFTLLGRKAESRIGPAPAPELASEGGVVP